MGFDYDADGRRVKKTNGTTGTLYWYGSGGEVLQETDLAGVLKREFVYFNGKRTARRDAPSGNVHYYFSDHLGSSNVVTSATGTIEEESDFYPFGAERVITDTLADQNYKFTGKERDSETNLDYFGARYYAFNFGRFVTPDWADKPTAVPYADFGNPQSLNLYTYVKNNPTTLRDPDGHCDIDCDLFIAVMQYMAAHLFRTGTGIESTRREYNQKSAQAPNSAARDALKEEYRAKGPPLGQELAKQQAQDPARTASRAAKTEAQLAESVTRTSPAATSQAKAFGAVGKVAGGVAVGIAVVNVANAPEGEKLNTASREAGGLAGAIGLGEAGAQAGAAAGPWGAAIGGLGGAIVGGFLGSEFMDPKNHTPLTREQLQEAIPRP